jgi:hypothetical protein
MLELMKTYEIERTDTRRCRHRGGTVEEAAAAHVRRCISTVAQVRRVSGKTDETGAFEALKRVSDQVVQPARIFFVREILR